MIVMVQQGQVSRIKSKATDGSELWGYRYRIGGRDSRRVLGGYAPEQDAAEALVASRIGERSSALVMFAAATGLRPGEWIALERRDIDSDARVVDVRRAFRNGRLKYTKTEGSIRALPLQAIALARLNGSPRAPTTMIDCHCGHLARDGRDHAINLLDNYLSGADGR